ncbi:unnamed protein product [Dicrocoelium dendriticum]|nr:unnamed protein product [Dicrocoelium dendriticum]
MGNNVQRAINNEWDKFCRTALQCVAPNATGAIQIHKEWDSHHDNPTSGNSEFRHRNAQNTSVVGNGQQDSPVDEPYLQNEHYHNVPSGNCESSHPDSDNELVRDRGNNHPSEDEQQSQDNNHDSASENGESTHHGTHEFDPDSPSSIGCNEQAEPHMKHNCDGTTSHLVDGAIKCMNGHVRDSKEDTIGVSVYLKVRIDARGYRQNDIKVSASRNLLVVHGHTSRSTARSCGSSALYRTVHPSEPVQPHELECDVTSGGVQIFEASGESATRESPLFSESLLQENELNVHHSPVLTNVTHVPTEPGFTTHELSERADATHLVVSKRK